MDGVRCPKCQSDDVVKIGEFYPDDSGEIMKCLDCDFEWGD
jgi:Zn ribbon nucleic-acid-binding protein